jgi:hypothetical protein
LRFTRDGPAKGAGVTQTTDGPMSESRRHEPSPLDARDDLIELAERYEQVAALDPIADRDALRASLGPRVPPGVQAFLDADEMAGALLAVDAWARYLGHALIDASDVELPDQTPPRLRVIAAGLGVLLEDERARLDILDELAGHLKVMRRLARRAQRNIRTGIACQDPTCRGQLTAPVGGPDRHDDALACDRCHRRVPFTVWSGWPRARITYVTVEHAARLVGTTAAAVKQRASRGRWRRVGTGRDVRYHVDDVRGSVAG